MMNCIIVDDEPLAREGIRNYVQEVDFLNLCGTANNALEIPKLMNESNTDLLFLDIQMPKMSGLEFLRSVKHPPMTIITTAYPNYALDGFELDVIDYLVKPIPFDRFFSAVSKAKRLFDLEHNGNTLPENTEDSASFFIRCDGKYERILQADILFIQAMQNYVLIQTKNRKYITLLYLKTVAKKLDPNRFARVHKSYIIALNKVDTLNQSEIQIAEYKIPLSRNYRKEVMEQIMGDRLWEK